MFALNILQNRPEDDIFLPPARPRSARGHRRLPSPPPPPSSSSSRPFFTSSEYEAPPPPPSILSKPPKNLPGFLMYFDPTCEEARKASVEVAVRFLPSLPFLRSNLNPHTDISCFSSLSDSLGQPRHHRNHHRPLRSDPRTCRPFIELVPLRRRSSFLHRTSLPPRPSLGTGQSLHTRMAGRDEGMLPTASISTQPTSKPCS